MIEAATRKGTVSHAAVARRIQRVTGCHFEPTDPRSHHVLGEISTEEDAAGCGLLSVVVVHKD